MKSINYLLVLFLFAFAACNNTSTEQNIESNEHKAEVTTEHEAHAESDDPCAHAKEHADGHWSYEGETGPEYWSCLSGEYKSCTGNHQSPIDIDEALEEKDLGELALDYAVTDGLSFINNGHTVQVNFKGDNNKLTLNGIEYKLKQFHFHAPSEHTFKGEAAAGELHMVHVSDDGDISVIGIMLEEGEENAMLATILGSMPTEVDGKNEIAASLNPMELLPEDQSCYTYSGSLTTPPCSEGVNWFVMKNKVTVSAEQLAALEGAVPENNARPVQPLNDRKVSTIE
ncbi:MAG: carbonic anhydrase [Marinilabiliales bacterium]|nr:MAG: carbonic anhydrase [Marinilabiliales bacterium]